ncbi:MAG TPA: D-alanine--D-alanine ligase [Paenalcaligenes sp.]|nr:D-alanine--D-alanine ligase [Paenalcaligenes sp.]
MSAAMGRVGVLYGGVSAEREVSLMSGQGVCKALRSRGVDAHLFDTGERSLAELAGSQFDRVFIALHGRHGEDGTLQGALELLGIPYTGSGPKASAVAMDKVMSKKIWQHAQLPTPGYVVLEHEAQLDKAVQELGFPFIMKPPHEGSTVGFALVESQAQVKAAFALAKQYDRAVLAEQFIAGRELTVPVLGAGKTARALPVIEIVVPEGGLYDYEHKYHSQETQYFCPADLPAAVTKQVQTLAQDAYRALDCEGWGRVDIMLDAQQQPWLLEINTSPGMTPQSLVPMAAQAQQMSYEDLCMEILQHANLKVHTAAAKDE